MITFNSKYAGQYYSLKGGEVYERTAAGVFKYAGAGSSGITTVQLSGYTEVSAKGNQMYQSVGGGWIDLNHGWQYQAYAPIRMYSAKDAQSYVNKVIKANAAIYENNLVCARFASKLTSDEQLTLFELQTRLNSRNNRLLSDGYCAEQKVSSPPGYHMLDAYLQAFMDGTISGVGVVISTTTIVVSAVVVASLATAAYFAYKYMASEAEKDVKYSEELTKILMERLTPEEYDQLMEETQGIVTKSRLLSKFGGALDVLKWGLLAAAGYVVYDYFKKKKGNKV